MYKCIDLWRLSYFLFFSILELHFSDAKTSLFTSKFLSVGCLHQQLLEPDRHQATFCL